MVVTFGLPPAKLDVPLFCHIFRRMTTQIYRKLELKSLISNTQYPVSISYWILDIAGAIEGLCQSPAGQHFGQVPAIFC